MMVWLGHEPLGPQGGRYGYGKLARRLFNVHVSSVERSLYNIKNLADASQAPDDAQERNPGAAERHRARGSSQRPPPLVLLAR